MEIDQGWARAQAAASWTGESGRWRAELAEAIRAAAGAVFAAVYTCPPDQPLEADGAVAPADHRPTIERLVREVLPQVERSDEDSAMRWSRQTRGMAYAPLAEAQMTRLAERARKDVLRPAGIDGLLTSYLVGARMQVLGYIVLATERPCREALADSGQELGMVAVIASQTAQAALALAEGFGALPARALPEARNLSTRERQVLKLIGEGLSDAEIATRLEISEQTVGSHLRRIFTKLGVHSRTELMRRSGLR